MVVKLYVSGISGNKEVKKRQQRVLMILDSKHITYEVIDIAEPGKESSKEYMQNNSKSNGGTVSDPNPRHPLPPQLFHDDEYCGDYDQFDLANEIDTLEQFLKVEVPPEAQVEEKADETPKDNEVKNGLPEKEDTEDKESKENTDEADSKEKSEERESSPKKSVEREVLQNNDAKENHDEKESSPKIKDEDNKRDSSPKAEEQDVKGSERETTPKADEEKAKSKESTPAKEDAEADEDEEDSAAESEEEEEQDKRQANGTVSSRESSQEVEEKVTVERRSENEADLKKDLSPSEKLILSEAAAE